MTREIKFTSFGIPYILEFENVSFVPERPPSPEPRHSLYTTPSSSSSSFCYIDSPPPPSRFPSFSLPSASSLFKRKNTQHSPPRHTIPSRTSDTSEGTKPLPPPPRTGVSETHGIYIQFPAERSHPQMSRKERLVHLQQTISMAVLDAGMSRSPGNTSTRSEEHSNGNAIRGSRGHRTPDALFCGTYGQLVAALEGAGLSATPYAGDDLSGCGLFLSFEDPSCTRISTPLQTHVWVPYL